MGTSVPSHLPAEKTFGGVVGRPDVRLSAFVAQQLRPWKGGREAPFYGLLSPVYAHRSSTRRHAGRASAAREKAREGAKKAGHLDQPSSSRVLRPRSEERYYPENTEGSTEVSMRAV